MANKKTLPPDIAQAAEAAGVDEYVDRRANPATNRPDYVIEDDPILAEGDARVRASEPETAEAQPRVAIAADADPIARLAASMEKLAERQAGPAPMDPILVTLLAGMMETMKSLVQQQVVGNAGAAEAIRKSQDPSNMFAPDMSVFNPRGERDFPRPQLKCRMFLPWEAERESLTREEIELLNLLEPGEFFIRRNDESRMMVDIKATINPNSGKFDRLLMNSETGFNNDYHWLVPPLRHMLRQILRQRPATAKAADAVMTTEREIELITEHGINYDKVEAVRESVNA